jgi:hypothetical protein
MRSICRAREIMQIGGSTKMGGETRVPESLIESS